MNDFLRYKAYAKLERLAQSPPDLTDPKVFTPERIDRLVVAHETFQLLFAAERVDEEILEALLEMSEEARVAEKMKAMQSGEVLNVSENRSVLHTAMRDFFDKPNTGKRAIEATKAAAEENRKLKEFMESSKEFTDLIVIGIGGSELGCKALALAMQRFNRPDRRLHFISTVDPDNTARVLGGLDLHKTLVAVISKSGGTLETVTNESLLRHFYEQAGISSKGHFIAVTGKGSPMDDAERYVECFYMWDFIGGRYSVTSMPGAVPLVFCLGHDTYLEFLRGAHSMDRHVAEAKGRDNLPLISALLGIWNRNFLHHHSVAIIPYSQALGRFAAHLQQLDMESNGKQVDKKGKKVSFDTAPIIWGEPGTNAQHSFFQMLHQGTTPVPIEFIGFKENQYGRDLNIGGTTSQEKLLSNLFAQSMGLATGKQNENSNKNFPGNRPSRVLLGHRPDPFTMGALLAYYEHKVVFQGFIWDINSFDQEGVQLGKVLANQTIELFADQNRGEKGNFPLGEAYIRRLR